MEETEQNYPLKQGRFDDTINQPPPAYAHTSVPPPYAKNDPNETSALTSAPNEQDIERHVVQENQSGGCQNWYRHFCCGLTVVGIVVVAWWGYGTITDPENQLIAIYDTTRVMEVTQVSRATDAPTILVPVNRTIKNFRTKEYLSISDDSTVVSKNSTPSRSLVLTKKWKNTSIWAVEKLEKYFWRFRNGDSGEYLGYDSDRDYFYMTSTAGEAEVWMVSIMMENGDGTTLTMWAKDGDRYLGVEDGQLRSSILGSYNTMWILE